MPDPFFSNNSGDSEIRDPVSASRVTAIIELMEFSDLVKEDNIKYLNDFYHDLSQEMYFARRQNYCLGLRVLEPEIQIVSERIILTSPLFLEKDLPELSSVAFKVFVDFCNLILSVALKHEIALKGMGNIGENFRGMVFSGNMTRAQARESMVLSDILKVFTFEEIFPEGFGQKIMPPVNIPYFYGEDISNSITQLSSVNDIGIFMPLDILENSCTEITVYSEMLVEQKVGRKKMYACNWKTWVEKNPENHSLEEIRNNLLDLSNSENGRGKVWKRFMELG
ncbi:MAG: hypothetical protein ACOCWA_05670 [Bacteroidota bacterium]